MAKTTVDWSGGPTAGTMTTVPDAWEPAGVDPNLEAMKKWLWLDAQRPRQQPTLQRQAAAMEDWAGPVQHPQQQLMAEPIQNERMVMISKPGPYPGTVSASHRVPESLLSVYLEQGWRL